MAVGMTDCPKSQLPVHYSPIVRPAPAEANRRPPNRFITRRVREAGVSSELLPFDAPWSQVEQLDPGGIILSGGPASVYEDGAPARATPCDSDRFG